jgi:predicted TIM-barrel fold metal-dependent hydrolase
MEWELEEILSLPIGDEKKDWILSENLRRLVGLN